MHELLCACIITFVSRHAFRSVIEVLGKSILNILGDIGLPLMPVSISYSHSTVILIDFVSNFVIVIDLALRKPRTFDHDI